MEMDANIKAFLDEIRKTWKAPEFKFPKHKEHERPEKPEHEEPKSE